MPGCKASNKSKTDFGISSAANPWSRSPHDEFYVAKSPMCLQTVFTAIWMLARAEFWFTILLPLLQITNRIKSSSGIHGDEWDSTNINSWQDFAQTCFIITFRCEVLSLSEQDFLRLSKLNRLIPWKKKSQFVKCSFSTECRYYRHWACKDLIHMRVWSAK